jgi:ubiquinone/menaquinone biosynthesis C-methylase UbiE
METPKSDVREFWDKAACGEELYLDAPTVEGYAKQAAQRYKLEPYIVPFADFARWKGKRVLEIGVGLGADHQRFAEAGAKLQGIDLTKQAIHHATLRFELLGLKSQLRTGDAEQLEFSDNEFDLVYSWGVIHHSPDTNKAASDILRVLRPGGHFRVMIYNKYSIVGFMLWLRYALVAGRPFRSLDDIYANHLESPGTKAYTKTEAAQLFMRSEELKIETVLTHGDLLEGEAGQRHRGMVLTIARFLWPRRFISAFFPQSGLFMLISGRKPLRSRSSVR